jgi:hypothetical protein
LDALVPANRGKKLEIERRRQQVADLYMQRHAQAAIAERLGISQATISADLKRIRRQWRESTVRDFDLAQAESLQEVHRIRREAWAAWELSKKPHQSAVLNGDGGTGRKTVKNQHGDSRFLAIILDCNATEQALLGLAAPTRIEPVMPSFQPMTTEVRLQHIQAILEEQERVIDEVRPNEEDDDGSQTTEASADQTVGRGAVAAEPPGAEAENGS